MSERAKQIEQLVSLSIIALLIIGSIVLVFPFLTAILWAVVFTVTIWPFFIKVEKAWEEEPAWPRWPSPSCSP